ncbi:MAG: Ig-like domain-containing protein, partial [Verrucomicrobia bacterium]|nr:Ig-like domain-containing protein [Verrucomicrobiota bacterium]
RITNTPPTLDSISSVAINENAGLQTVSLSGISSGATNEPQTLALTATSSNTGLIPNPTVTYTSPAATGSIAFTPVPYAFGSATITVRIDDGGGSNNIVTRLFSVTVNPVNQAPTLNALSNLKINANSGLQTVSLSGITAGPTNEPQTLTVTATSSNTGLIPNPTVTYTSPGASGSIAFIPVPDAYGSATITVTVNDGGTSNNIVSRSFSVTVNQAPTISAINNRVIAAGATTPALPFTIGDAETPLASLSLSATSSNPALVPNSNIVLGGSGSARTVTVTALAGQTGVATITITVGDGDATAISPFQITVRNKPAAPGNFHITQVLP